MGLSLDVSWVRDSKRDEWVGFEIPREINGLDSNLLKKRRGISEEKGGISVEK